MSNLSPLRQKLFEIKNSEPATSLSETETTNAKSYEGFYLFYSFDLVNATQFKDRNPRDWVEKFQYFYTRLQEKITEAAYFVNADTVSPSIKLWKSIGDELVFYQRVHSEKDLFFAPVLAYRIVDDFSNWMKEAFRNNLDELNILGLKSAVWVAHLNSELNEQVKNIIVQIDRFGNGERPNELQPDLPVDFLGPDIDLGFRLTKFTYKSRVVISADLAYFLRFFSSRIMYWSVTEKGNPILGPYDVSKRLKIINFEKLKGVWNNRYYPIIWYCEDWLKFSSYEEHLDFPLSKLLWEKKHYKIEYLDEVFKEANSRERFREMKQLIKELAHKNELPSVVRKSSAEVHCATIVLDLENEKALIVKRDSSKNSLGDHWEFGCSQITNNLKLLDNIKKDYKSDFNLDIEFFDDNLEGNILSTYQVDKSDGFYVTGFIIIAYTKQPETIKLQPSKHSQKRWISLSELDDLDTEKTVGGLKDNLYKVLNSSLPDLKEHSLEEVK
jgi:hypothetical protein